MKTLSALPILLGLGLCLGMPQWAGAQLFDNLRTLSNRIPLHASGDGDWGPKSICTGDFDGDQHLDFAVSGLNGFVEIRYGLGNGEFAVSTIDVMQLAVAYQLRAPSGLRQLITRDLNGDGKLDLISAAPLEGKVYVLLNQGNRVWSAPQVHTAWLGSRNLASGDFDGDGKMDLLVAGPDRDVTYDWTQPWSGVRTTGVQPTSGVQFWKGDGQANFVVAGNATELAVAAVPRWWDEDPDSFPRPVYTMQVIRQPGETKDLVVATHALASKVWVLEWNVALAKFENRSVSVLDSSIGTTGGALVTGVRALLVAPVTGVAASAPPDLLIASNDLNLVEIRAGITGTGIFSNLVSQRICVPGGPRAMEAKDLDGDGWLELIVITRNQHQVLVFKNSNGTLSLSSQAPTGYSPREMTSGDFDEDGKLDFLVLNRWSNDVSFLKGSVPIAPGGPPRTGFSALDQMYAVDGGVAQLGLYDLNGDGKQDVLQLHRASSEVSVRLAMIAGRLSEPTFYSMGSNPNALNLTDYNNDGKLDLFSVNIGDGQNPTGFSVRLGDGLGTFGAEIRYTPPPPPPPPPTLPVVPGQPVPPNITPRTSYFAVETADFDGDGTNDLVIGYYDCRIQFFKGLGNGSFTPMERTHTFAYESRSMVTGDFDGDGDIDLAGASAWGEVVVVENVGAFFTADPIHITHYNPPPDVYGGYRIIARDENGDGDLDLLVGNNQGITQMNGGPGVTFTLATFPPPPGGSTAPVAVIPSVSFSVSSFVIADLDGDGTVDDLAAACANDGCLNVSTVNGTGSWEQVLQVAVPQTNFLAAGDLDGDGKPDLVGSGAMLWVALSSRAATPAPPLVARSSRPTLPKVVINEIFPANINVPIISPQVLAGTKSDCVEIYNGATTAASLAGWKLTLTKELGVSTYTFPTHALAPDARVVLQCKKNPTTVWQTGWKLPLAGGKLTLTDATDTVIDEVTFPALAEDISYTRYSDGQATFMLNPNPDPGLPNEFNGTIEPSLSVHGPNLATLAAQVRPQLYVFGSDDTGIVAMNVFHRRKLTPGKFTATPLYDDGMHADGERLDSLFSGMLPNGYPAGTVLEFYVEALDLEGNTTVRPKGVTTGDENGAVPYYTLTIPGLNSGLEISEVVAGNLTGITTQLGVPEDWLEVRNTSSQPISLAGLELGQSLLGSDRFYFPDTMLAPGAYQIIFCDATDPATSTTTWNTPFKISRSGETLLLIRREAQGGQILVDRAMVPPVDHDVAYARMGAQGPFRLLSKPTPGAPNVLPGVGLEIFGDQTNGIFLLCRPNPSGGSAILQTAPSLTGPWQNVGAPLLTPVGSPGVEAYQQWLMTGPRQFFRMQYP